jgi:hypothetical protein
MDQVSFSSAAETTRIAETNNAFPQNNVDLDDLGKHQLAV